MTNRDIQQLLPISEHQFLILWALQKQPLHGYGILKKVEVAVPNLSLIPGTLYRILGRMADNKGNNPQLVKKLDPPENNDVRQASYYQLTNFGKEVFEAQRKRYQQFLNLDKQGDKAE